MIISVMSNTPSLVAMAVIRVTVTGDKTAVTETGPVQIAVPQDRDVSFEPAMVAKRQRRSTGVEDLAISLSVKGQTHGESSAHLAEVYGVGCRIRWHVLITVCGRVSPY